MPIVYGIALGMTGVRVASSHNVMRLCPRLRLLLRGERPCIGGFPRGEEDVATVGRSNPAMVDPCSVREDPLGRVPAALHSKPAAYLRKWPPLPVCRGWWVAHAAPDGGLVDARFLALLRLLRSKCRDLPVGSSRSQHLEHSKPCAPRVTQPQTRQVVCCRDLRLDLTQQREHRGSCLPRWLPPHAWQVSGCQVVPAFWRAYQSRWRWALVGSLGISGLPLPRSGWPRLCPVLPLLGTQSATTPPPHGSRRGLRP